MDVRKIVADLNRYTDPHGLVQPVERPGIDASGNGILYTAEAIVCLDVAERRSDSGFDKAMCMLAKRRFASAISACAVSGFPGVYNRSRTKKDQQGPDDYVGACLAFLLADWPGHAETILAHGKRDFFVYNNVAPGTLRHQDGRLNYSAMFFRFPALIAHMYTCAGKKPAAPLRWYRSLSLVACAMLSSAENTNAWILSALKIVAMQRDGNLAWHESAAIALWKRRFRKKLGSEHTLFSIYFQNSDHPIAKYFSID